MSRMSITIDVSDLLDKNSAEQRKLRDQADELVVKVESENREYTKDEEAKLKELQEGIVSIGKRNDALKRQAEIRKGLEEPGESRTAKAKLKPTGKPDDGDEDEAKEIQKRYKRAFGNYLRGGVERLGPEEREVLQRGYTTLPTGDMDARDLSAITGTTGGFAVPQEFSNQVEVAMRDFSGVLQSRAQVITTGTGADLPWPTINDTTNEGEQVDENTATGTQDITFGQITAKAYLFSSRLILVPLQLMQDTAIDLEGLLASLFAERLGRIQNRRFTTGNNANQPQGVVTASTLGRTAAASAAITYDETIDLQHSVDPAYRLNGEYMFNDNTLALLRKLKDADGRPIWQPSMTASMANGAPGTLNGSPYWINQHMANAASGARSMLFGDFSKYKIRSVKGMTIVRLTERYAEKFQVGFMAFKRLDGRLSNAGTNPITHLLHP